jgi:aromatic-amino-acid transaminase
MTFLIPSTADRPGDDPIFAISAEASARVAAGEDVINATLGVLLDDEGRLAVFPTVVEAIRETPPEVTAAYAPIAGPPAFLRAVVGDLLGARPEAAWAVAVATPGGSGAVRVAITNFLEPGQSLLTTNYHWAPYRTIADDSGRGVETFRMFDERGRLDTRDFDRKLRELLDKQGRALAILNSPCHNPTGYSFHDEEWEAIVEAVANEAHRGPIALAFDVAYARYGATDLSRAVDKVLPIADKVQLLFAWSASKSFAEYGLRVGALVGLQKDPAERRILDNAFSFACRATWSNCNAGGMAAIARLLSDPALRARVDRERGALKALLDRRVARWNELAHQVGLRYPRYDGGFFVTVFCEDSQAACARLKAEGVYVVALPGALRVALCAVPERDVPRLVDAMGRVVR